MPDVSRVIGGAGTGKTTHLLNIMEKVLATGVDPFQVGFVSFTKAARQEASTRAGEKFDIDPKSLERDGWFRTIHSICYSILGVGKRLLPDDDEGREFLKEFVAPDAGFLPTGGAEDETLMFGQRPKRRSDADTALALWNTARNRMTTLAATWDRSSEVDHNIPPLSVCREYIIDYERAKRLRGRVDFVDILGEFAGVAFDVDSGPKDRIALGVVPNVTAWFLDEQQDASPLLDAVCRRLVEPSKWVYVVGDAFQAIYGWAGADPECFLGWDVSGRERVLDQTYRCPAPVIELSEKILKKHSKYWDRGIKPAPHSGSVERVSYDQRGAVSVIQPGEDWLVLARTNFLAKRLATRLTGQKIPWTPLKGNNQWTAPLRNRSIIALMALAEGHPITAEEWRNIHSYIPTSHEGTRLLTHGTKAEWVRREGGWDELAALDGLEDWGAAPGFADFIRGGKWQTAVKFGREFMDAVGRWGLEVTQTPTIRLGTIHSAKGMEADNVFLFSTSSEQVSKQRDLDVNGADEECCVEYVGVTRARYRLVIADEPDARHKLNLGE